MRQLTNHLPACAMLNQQCVLATYFGAPRNVCHFNEQRRITTFNRRDAAIDDAFFGVHFGSTKAHFICVVVAGFDDATKDVAQFGLIVDELQQGFALRALNADAQNVFGGRIQADDQQGSCREE